MFYSIFSQLIYVLSTANSAEFTYNQDLQMNANPAQQHTEILSNTMQTSINLDTEQNKIFLKDRLKYDFLKSLCEFNKLFYTFSFYSSSLCFEERSKIKNCKFEIVICFGFMEIYAYSYIFSSNELKENVDSDCGIFNDIMLEYNDKFAKYFSLISDSSKANTNICIYDQLLNGFEILKEFNIRIISFIYNRCDKERNFAIRYCTSLLEILKIYNINTLLFLSKQNMNDMTLHHTKYSIVDILSSFNMHFILNLFNSSCLVNINNISLCTMENAAELHEEFIIKYNEHKKNSMRTHDSDGFEKIITSFVEIFKKYFEQNNGLIQFFKNVTDDSICYYCVLEHSINIYDEFLAKMKFESINNSIQYHRREQIAESSTNSIKNDINDLYNQQDKNSDSIFINRQKELIENLKLYNILIFSYLPKDNNSCECKLNDYDILLNALTDFNKKFHSYFIFFESFYCENTQEKNIEEEQIIRFFNINEKESSENVDTSPKTRFKTEYQLNQNITKIPEIVEKQIQEAKEASIDALKKYNSVIFNKFSCINRFIEEHKCISKEKKCKIEELQKNIFAWSKVYTYFIDYFEESGQFFNEIKSNNENPQKHNNSHYVAKFNAECN
ncbi:hypothetical protein EDEG_01693 [Edhazardia aedis USNM 41457]|uniref:Uncharacterized protein n=1 Tax=Edhazardia aedis (strain USNM 41457) TaxID=1003232 RepID=J9DNA5_EDHAE|nr:hypothetical protein EDEG_01693 [Edhazardia aedis USNM 41457]|eukprot:EJW04020.1 hypothetical protein EDEG_01693 [Edhazardia aedis USNM 41457]